MLTLYARKEPTQDSVAKALGLKGKQDTVFYRDRACTQVMARKPWHQSGQPRRNSKRVTLNCYNWNLEWVH